MDFLNSLLETSSMPWLSAIVLGLMTAISPCPLATNITAIGFISKDIQNKERVFINGVLYTLGRTLSYSGIAMVLFLGADTLKITDIFQRYGDKFIGPLLIFIGLFMTGIIRLNFRGTGILSGFMQDKMRWRFIDVLLLGIVFALAFCPYSGVLYFGILVPMTLANTNGLFLPIIFSIASGIPVIILAWVLAYAVSGIGSFYKKMKEFEIIFRKVIAIVFIATGAFYIIRVYL